MRTGPPTTSRNASAMAARSAAMLIVFATTSNATSPIEGGRRQLLGKIAGKAPTRLPADGRADDLDRNHEWQGEEHGPAEREAELRACLRVGRNAARVVIRRSGDKAGPEQPEKGWSGLASCFHSGALRCVRGDVRHRHQPSRWQATTPMIARCRRSALVKSLSWSAVAAPHVY